MPKDRENPYINMTLAEVTDAESRFYYIQVGGDTAEFNGRQTFTKDKTEYLFAELLENLRDMYAAGNDEERLAALLGLHNFHMRPLRIH